MDLIVEYVLQFGALGLLGYLIIWTTVSGAPRLFMCLQGIQQAVEVNSERLSRLEMKQEQLLGAILKVNADELREEREARDPVD